MQQRGERSLVQRHSETNRCPAFWLLSALVLTLALPVDAEARSSADEPRVLILRTEGTVLDDDARIALTKALGSRARQYKHLQVVVSASDLVEEMFAFECTEAGVECLSQIGAKYKADRVIYSEVVKDSAGNLQWQLRVVQMKNANEPIARVAQSTTQPLEDARRPRKAAENGLLVLIGPVDLPQKKTAVPGTLHVQLVGGGVALVYVDDKLAGRSSVSGLKIKLAPGEYQVRVVRAGFKDWNSKAKIASGATETLTVELQTAPTPVAPTGPGGKVATVPVTRTWWFWTAVGVAAVGAGVAVYALTRPDATKTLGNAAFSIDSDDAHLDPVFGGG